MQLRECSSRCWALAAEQWGVRGDPADQERAIARPIAAGVNYCDAAVQYGNGESEKNLCRVFQS